MSRCLRGPAAALFALWCSVPGSALLAAESDPPPLSVRGNVVDADGHPIIGARVVLREWSNMRYGEDPFNPDVRDILAETSTDSQGRFQFDEVASRPFATPLYNSLPWDVVVQADGMAMAWVHLSQHQSSRPVTIKMSPECTVEGRLVGPDNKPVASAKVRVWSIDPPGTDVRGNDNEPGRIDLSLSQLCPTATTDGDGGLVLRGLPVDRRLSAMVEHPNYATTFFYIGTTKRPQPDAQRPGSNTETLPVLMSGFSQRLERGGQIRGRISFADDGRPYADAKFTASAQSRYMHENADGEGRFELTGVPAGEYDLRVQAPMGSPYLHGKSTVTVGEGNWEPTIEISLDTGIEVRGTVRDDESGAGVAGVQVIYQPEVRGDGSNWSPSQPATTDPDGHFTIFVSAGRGVLQVGGGTGMHPTHDVPNYWRLREMQSPPPGWSAAIDVSATSAPQDVELTVGRGLVIRGRIVHSTGEPMAGVSVVARDQFRLPDRERQTTTDENGQFELSGFLASSEQTLEMIAQDGASRRSLSVEADESAVGSRIVQLPDTQLSPTASVTGIVLGDGQPLADAQVTLSILVGRSEHGGFSTRNVDSVTTDNQGRYRFTGIEAGKEIYLDASRTGYTDAGSRTFFKLKANEELELDPMEVQSRVAYVAGVVVDPDGNPVAGATVSVSRRNGGSISNAFTRDPTGPDGLFRIEGLPDVPLEVMAYIRPTEPTQDHAIRFPAYVEAEPDDNDLRIVLDPKLQRPLP